MRNAALVLLVLSCTQPYGVLGLGGELRPVHPPILIDGDASFSLPGSGVLGGEGTPSSPYRIERWSFPLSGLLGVHEAAITIRNTRAHVLITDNDFSGVRAGTGVFIEDASNVTVHGNDFHGVSGVMARRDSNVSISGNLFREGRFGLLLSGSQDVVVRENDIGIREDGLFPAAQVKESDRVLVEGNTIVSQNSPALKIKGGGSIIAVRNHIHNSSYGIDVEAAENFTAIGNRLTDNGGVSASLAEVRTFSVLDNVISRARGSGLYIKVAGPSAESSSLRGNVIAQSSRPLFIDGLPPNYPLATSDNVINDRPLLHFDRLRNQTLDGSGVNASYVLLTDAENVTVENWVISSNAVGPMFISNGKHVRVRNNTFVEGGGLRLIGGKAFDISRNSFVDLQEPAIWVSTSETDINNNTMVGGHGALVLHPHAFSAIVQTFGALSAKVSWNSFQGGYSIGAFWADDILIEHNVVFGTPAFRYSSNVRLDQNNVLSGTLEAWQPANGVQIDARFNWWGTGDGPFGIDGKAVNVLPWLEGPAEAGAMPPPGSVS